MRRQVIEDHHVPPAERRRQHLLDIRQEGRGVARAGDRQRGIDAIEPHGRDDRDRLPGARSRVDDPLPPGGTPIRGRHRCGDPRLVHEDQALGVDRFDHLAERFPPHLDVGAVALVGLLGLLLAGDAQRLQAPPDDHETAADAEALAKISEGGIGIILDELAEPLEGLLIQGGGLAAGMGPGLDRAGPATESEQSGDR